MRRNIESEGHWSGLKKDMMFHLGNEYALYGELFKRRGDPLKAKEKLSKAIETL